MNTWDWLFFAAFAWWLSAIWLNVMFTRPVTLWQRGRWALIFDAADFWVGMFYDRRKRRLYLVLVPTLPLRYQRGADVGTAC